MIYRHHKGGRYRVLFIVNNSTNGPDDGKQMICYVSMTTGRINVRDFAQFHEALPSGERRFTLEMR